MEPGFAEQAAVRQVFVASVALPARQVFQGLAAHPKCWPHWFGVVRACRYLGDPPYGVGTVRHLRLRGGAVARERILVWNEPSGQLVYRVEEANAPGVAAVLEQWTVQAVTDDRTTVRWVVAVDGSGAVRLLLRAMRARTERVFHTAMRRLEEQRGRCSGQAT